MKAILSLTCSSLIALALAGCSPSGPAPEAGPPKADESHEGHEHGEHGAGPHGGTIGEWGGAYHIEFVVDHARQEATVYILGGDVKTPAPLKTDKLTLAIDEPAFTVELAAQPLEGETGGMSSRFVGQHESLGKVQEFAGSVTGEAEGTPYTGEFKEVAAGHAHEHEEKP